MSVFNMKPANNTTAMKIVEKERKALEENAADIKNLYSQQMRYKVGQQVLYSDHIVNIIDIIYIKGHLFYCAVDDSGETRELLESELSPLPATAPANGEEWVDEYIKALYVENKAGDFYYKGKWHSPMWGSDHIDITIDFIRTLKLKWEEAERERACRIVEEAVKEHAFSTHDGVSFHVDVVPLDEIIKAIHDIKEGEEV